MANKVLIKMSDCFETQKLTNSIVSGKERKVSIGEVIILMLMGFSKTYLTKSPTNLVELQYFGMIMEPRLVTEATFTRNYVGYLIVSIAGTFIIISLLKTYIFQKYGYVTK